MNAPMVKDIAFCAKGILGSLREFNDPEAEANARLISAAPDLLESCERLYNNMMTPPFTIQLEDADFLRAAIAKARGEVSESENKG